MASSKKSGKKAEEVKQEDVVATAGLAQVVTDEEPKKEEKPVTVELSKETKKKEKKIEEPKQKYSLGSIVYIAKDAGADLNGFKLFPQYKKYTYTVEAYDQDTGVYTLRRLNLSLKLPEALILSPDERAHDALNRKQF